MHEASGRTYGSPRVHAELRRRGWAVNPQTRGHFPTEQAAMKWLYLVTRSLDSTGAGRARWAQRWKPVINAFAIAFSDRWPTAETY